MPSISLAALVVLSGVTVASPAVSPGLPFVSNDYGRALARAQSENRPLFVETWAPWCHTCRSMRAFVLTDETLTRRAGQFVWLAVDTDQPQNEAVLGRFPVDAWPTFRVIDPKTETVILERVGSLTVAQVHAFLDEAQATFVGRVGDHAADRALGEADRLVGQRRYIEAAGAYRKALDAAPPVWPPRTRAMEAELSAHQIGRSPEQCAARSLELLAGLDPRALSARLSVAGTGLQCALDSPREVPRREDWRAALEPVVARLLVEPGIDLAADDVSGCYLALAAARKEAGDELGRRKVLTDWVAFLESQAAVARTPEQRAVFDSHRLTAYFELGTPERALPMLEASERDLPEDYNPPARLALAFQAMRRWDEGVAASDRALARVQGPRRLRILRVKAETQEGKGDVAGALTTLGEGVAFARTLENGEERAKPLLAKIEALRQSRP